MLAACEAEEVTSCLGNEPAPVRLSASTSIIGSDSAYREERPIRRVRVMAFDIDATEVTNGQFARFVEAVGYVTDSERPQSGFGVAGGAVFMPPSLRNPNWWRFVEGANWRHPEGPSSSIQGREHFPVVQVSFNDARAYADWAGRRLPTEVEWEYAARGGAETVYVWGHERAPGGKEHANTWQGSFPINNTVADGYLLRAPVGCFPPNHYGLYDMIGNVWEWTDTLYRRVPGEAVYTIKGGSFLCAENFCRRYRAPARQAQQAGLTTNHTGFRTVSSIKDSTNR